MSAEKIEVGDYICIGKNPLTWEVVGMPDLGPDYSQWVTLKSGQSARHRMERIERLRFHSAARK